ncbi:short-chain dehydrogenase/reductase [Pleomassaria siparia CBS 279.74]|uniref:Short-chain dehydrogenase/reductase n=1 Tax=Pleomassaria siparia CBS 279.74 TaxID=1314801 RepID=A0A6G1K8Q1_9PLEO|nr:short-chain dehydrogenase/reductase [Pleomassaria siparia CBS 279.74]
MAPPRKSVLITGCSANGIGAGLAEVFHEKGYHVFATARTPSKVPPTLSSSANVTVLRLDVVSPESIAAAVESVSKETDGRLDVLINNSGGTLVLPALDIPIEEGKKIFDLNFWAPLAMLQAFAPLLIKSRGCVVNNTSANAVCPMPLMSVYNGSKAALATSSETWRRELEPLGVRTITLMTCGVKTKFVDNYHVSFRVPETSQYFKIRDFIESLPSGRLQEGAISPKQFGVKVVQVVEKGTVGTVWAGTNAFWARVEVWLSPQLVLMIHDMQGRERMV